MTDPAIEAARRALALAEGIFPIDQGLQVVSVSAAREALTPVRAVLDKLAADTEPPCDFATRIQLFEKAISDLSPSVYTTEELER